MKKVLSKDAYHRQRQETDPDYKAQCFRNVKTNIETKNPWVGYRSDLAMTALAYRKHIKPDFSEQIGDVIELALETWLGRK
ncbi:MAG: hypothetical protein AAF609_21680 [Cyanobacteria bacterium P01_C01_bin.120]